MTQTHLRFNVFFSLALNSDFVCLGHSFGGATTLLTLSKDSRFKVGIVLDGWLFPLRDDEDVAKSAKQPVLFVNTGEIILLFATQLWHHMHQFFLDIW